MKKPGRDADRIASAMRRAVVHHPAAREDLCGRELAQWSGARPRSA
jgi:hypothetical protein